MAELPTVFFDLETTGADVATSRIVQLATRRIELDGSVEEKCILINPLVPILDVASGIHGIRSADVADKPTFRAYSAALLKYFTGVALGGYNIINFDIPLLQQEFHRAGIDWRHTGPVFDGMDLWRAMEPRNLGAAHERFAGSTMDNAHDAAADVLASWRVFAGQLEAWGLSEEDAAAMIAARTANRIDACGKFVWVDLHPDKQIATFTFGKHRDKPVSCHPDFLSWMLNKGNFHVDTNRWALAFLRGTEPTVRDKPCQ